MNPVARRRFPFSGLARYTLIAAGFVLECPDREADHTDPGKFLLAPLVFDQGEDALDERYLMQALSR